MKKYIWLLPILFVFMILDHSYALEKQLVEPVQISVKGSGQQASKRFVLNEGLSVFSLAHNGDENFVVWLLNDEGDLKALLVNRIGDFKGSKAFQIESKGKHILDITADGNWTIKIKQPRPKTAYAATEFHGNDQMATDLFFLNKGLKIFKMKHNGDANFAPWLLDKNGKMLALLANTIGEFEGSKAVKIPKDGLYLIDVTANGKWDITIE